MRPQVFPALLSGAFQDAAFEAFREGVDICHLHRSVDGDGMALALLRYRPGASVPMHEHVGAETICVLSGSQSDEAGTYGTGDVVVNPAGSRHSVRSEEGCIVLISWARPIRFVVEE